MSRTEIRTGPGDQKSFKDGLRQADLRVRVDVGIIDARAVSVPIKRYLFLCEATPEKRQAYKINSGGASIHWPEVHEELSVAGLLARADGRAAVSLIAPQTVAHIL